jgi:2-polyprenyl-3-methyl-5-hydroxy-6-metoxy-1,4-benzoquinol methylase
VTYVDTYDPDTDFDTWYTHATAAALTPCLRAGHRVLELGCATGLMTVALAATGATVTAVDRFEAYLERARARRLDGVSWVCDDVVDFDDGCRYDHVVATNLLHELADPHRFLQRCAQRLAGDGRLHLTVPNPRSIHRLVAHEMGLIDELDQLSELSRRLGHRGHLDLPALVELIEGVGLRLAHRQGVALKPLPNHMLAALPAEVLDGLARAARHFPDHSAFHYLVVHHA